MRFKKGGVIGVVILLAILSSFSTDASAVPGCFNEPGFVTSHNGRSGCEFIEEAVARDICSQGGTKTPQETQLCISLYFDTSVTLCSQLSICTRTPNTWCGGLGDTCQAVNFQAECTNRQEWIGLMNGAQPPQPNRCAQGCCACTSTGICPRDATTSDPTLVTQEQCQQYCSGFPGINVGQFKVGATVAECRITCQTPITALNGRITGVVRDNNNPSNPIADAIVRAWNEVAQTDAQGQYELRNIPSGNTLITASHPLFTTQSAQITLTAPVTTATQDFQLARAQKGTIQGRVTDANNAPVKDVIITSGDVTTTSVTDGTYKLLGVPFGQQTVSTSHSDFEPKQETISTPLSAQNDVATLNIQLTRLQQATLNIEVKDGTQRPVAFAAITIDNVFVGHATSSGTFEIKVLATSQGTQHIVKVSHPNFNPIDSQTITVQNSEVKTLSFLGVAINRECANPVKKPVDNFRSENVRGEKSVVLKWTQPCVGVVSYAISRREKIGQGSPIDVFKEIAVIGTVQGVLTIESFKDEDVEWGKTYEYSIVAIYTDGGVRKSDERKTEINIGNARCEGTFKSNDAIEFCSDDDTKRQQCNANNQIVPAESGGALNDRDCSRQGSTFFCSVTSTGDTRCRDAGRCTASRQLAIPFGLWFMPFSPTGCYGAFNPDSQGLFDNFCTYDKALSGTIFDQCISCNQVDSCSDYKTEDACTINNCRAGDKNECGWVPASNELNTGFCVEADSKKNDECSACSNGDSVFSGKCSADICMALGACFSRPDKTTCTECITGETQCEAFTTKNECIGNGNNPRVIGGIYRESEDACTIGRCAWDTNAQFCFKDGNADGADDCKNSQGSNCGKDSTPPTTTILPGIVRIGKLSDSIQFIADDNPNRVFACISKTNTCFPDRSGTTNVFGYITNGSNTNIASATAQELGLDNVYALGTAGPTRYFIRFFSEDIFSNIENIKSVAIEADLDAPKITIENVTELLLPQSKVKLIVHVDEPAKCVDELKNIGSQEIIPSKMVTTRGSEFVTDYILPDSIYEYTVTCTDDFSNEGTEVIPDLLVDNDDSITVKSPPRATNNTYFPIIVETTDPSSCELVEGSAKEIMTTDSTRKTHTSQPRTFPANVHQTTLRVECVEDGAFGSDHHTKFLLFAVDQAPPLTRIHLSGKDGLEREFNNSGWNGQFTSEVEVALKCADLPEANGRELGFGCKETLYCLNATAECIPKETKTPIVVDKNTQICYFSKDKHGFTEIRKCGTITVDKGFGIKFITPRYGVSSVREFDLGISTEIPSDVCKWVNAVPFAINFNAIVAGRNIFQKVSPNEFKIPKFNEQISLTDGDLHEIDVICNATNGVISPPHRLLIGFDTTAPRIRNAQALPRTVIEGNNVRINIETDESTLCRYGVGKTFTELTSTFDGFQDDFFLDEHEAIINLDSAHDQKSHAINVSCINRAEIPSNITQVEYSVNFSTVGAITSLRPTGALNAPDVEFEIKTSKIASCEIADTINGTVAFTSTSVSDGITHKQPKTAIAAGPQNFRVRCNFLTPATSREGTISFIVDRTPPRIKSVNDKNVSCSTEKVSIVIDAEDGESSVDLYLYELFKRNSVNVTFSSNTSDNNIKIEDLNLTLGSEYFFKVSARDAAGNRAAPFSSDGFTVVDKNDSRCNKDFPPQLSLKQNTTRKGVEVTVNCRDENGCFNIRYGTATSSCTPSIDYDDSVIVSKDTTFCARANDRSGHNSSVSQKITVPDKDKDGITDGFDKCPSSPAGETVDNEGCSTSELFVDTDKDGLEDSWEFQYDANDCELNARERDSNANGIEDGKEDYDADGIQNKDEQRSKTHPCIVQRQPPKNTTTIITPPVVQEESSIVVIIIMILGIFLVIGGVVYLIVMTKSKKQEWTPEPVLQSPVEEPEPQPEQDYQPLREAIIKERKERKRSEFERKKKIFDAFSGFNK